MKLLREMWPYWLLLLSIGFWGVGGYVAAAPYTEHPGRVIAGFVFMVNAAGLYVIGWICGMRALSKTMHDQLEQYKAYCDGVANEYRVMMERFRQTRGTKEGPGSNPS